MKKNVLRILSFVLTLALVLQMAPAFAASDAGDRYYVSLGDSIAAGFLVPSYTPVTLSSPDEYPAYCFPAQLGKMLGAKTVKNFGKPASTTTDLLDILTNDDNAWHGQYVNALQNATDVTVEIGSNDFIVGILKSMFAAAGISCTYEAFNEYTNASLKIVQALLDNQGSIEAVSEFRAILEEAKGTEVTDLQLIAALEVLQPENLAASLETSYNSFYDKIDQVFEKLFAVNGFTVDPDDVAAIGYYNPLYGQNLNIKVVLAGQEIAVKCSLGSLVDTYIVKANTRLKAVAAKYKIHYVDTYSGLTIPSGELHPNVASHLEIAKRAANALNVYAVEVTAGNGGSVAVTGARNVGSGVYYAEGGADVQCAITLQDTFRVNRLLVDEKEQTGFESSSFTLSNVSANHTLDFSFTNSKQYNDYTAMGDSVCAGYSLPGFTGDGSNPDNCYAAQLGAEIGANNVYNLAKAGMNSEELRTVLTDPNNTWHDEFVNDIKEAEIITLGIGVNDITMSVLDTLLGAIGVDTTSITRDQHMAYLTPLMDCRTMEDIIKGLAGFYDIELDADKMASVIVGLQLGDMRKLLNNAYIEFESNYKTILETVRTLNPDAELYLVGCFNPFREIHFVSGVLTYSLGEVVGECVNKINNYTKNSEASCNGTYVDVTDVELLLDVELLTVDPHPTEAGHDDITNRILAAMNGKEFTVADSIPVGAGEEVLGATYLVYVGVGNNGTCDKTSGFYQNGTTFKFTPAKGYKISEVKVGSTLATMKSIGAVSTYTLQNPGITTCIAVSFEKAGLEVVKSYPGFADIPVNAWYRDNVRYVYERGLMEGTGNYRFSPEAATTRGMIVTILYRMEGSPAMAGTTWFKDVKSGSYYEQAVKWASMNGIVKGYGNGKFGPDDTITREQMAAILWRYAAYKGYDVTVSALTDINNYMDATSVSEYARTSMQWAITEEIIQGSKGYLKPQNSATRAEVAAILNRFCETYLG